MMSENAGAHLFSKSQEVRTVREEQKSSSILERQAFIRRLPTTRDFISTLQVLFQSLFNAYRKKNASPNGSHQAIDEKLVFLRRRLLSCIPDLTITTLHQPSFKVNRVADKGVLRDSIRGEGKGFKCCMELGDAVLS